MMENANILLILACGALGFGIIWTMIPARPAPPPPLERDDAPPDAPG